MDEKKLEQVFLKAQNYFPNQGPLSVFVATNPLWKFEDLSFFEAVENFANHFQGNPYLSHQSYLDLFRQGKIFLSEDQKKNPFLFIPKEKFYPDTLNLLVMQGRLSSLYQYTSLELEPLWKKINQLKMDEWLEQDHQKFPLVCFSSYDQIVNSQLIQMIQGYLDQGLSHWNGLKQDESFFKSCCLFLGKKIECSAKSWILKYGKNYFSENLEFSYDDWLLSEILKLRGWGTLFSFLERQPYALGTQFIKPKLEDLLAVRLLLISNPELKKNERSKDSSAIFYSSLKVELFRLCLFTGVLDPTDAWVRSMIKKMISITDFERRRLWQIAYEETYYTSVLKKLKISSKDDKKKKLSIGAIFCIDDREESIRRHLEIQSHSSDVEIKTYGYAGFFNLDMLFKPLGQNEYLKFCPAPMTPTLKLEEKSLIQSRRLKTAKKIHFWYQKTKSIRAHNPILETLFVTLFGFLGISSSLIRLVYPRWGKILENRIHKFLKKHSRSGIHYKKDEDDEHVEAVGMTTTQMADRVEGVLKAIGLVDQFPDAVLVIGHGSSSLNNPYASAYECGACSGKKGIFNSRLFAKISQDQSVRQILKSRGIYIPDQTLFFGGYHDTASDDISWTFSKNNFFPKYWNSVEKIFDQAKKLNAQERFKKFLNIGIIKTPDHAYYKAQARVWDLREPRPEYTHNRNGVCVVGRRSLSREIFLDRRAFLVSYDPTIDHQGDILVGLLGAIMPVCFGINMTYFFSHVDNKNHGSGSKLPLNISALVGVMTGSESDLRLGLPWQMVDIHEPLRMLFVVETTTEIMIKFFHKFPLLARVLENYWAHLVIVDPSTFKMFRFAGRSSDSFQFDLFQLGTIMNFF